MFCCCFCFVCMFCFVCIFCCFGGHGGLQGGGFERVRFRAGRPGNQLGPGGRGVAVSSASSAVTAFSLRNDS